MKRVMLVFAALSLALVFVLVGMPAASAQGYGGWSWSGGDARSGYERRFHERQRAGEAENQRLQLQGIERELREQNRLEMQRRLRTAPEPARRIPGVNCSDMHRGFGC